MFTRQKLVVMLLVVSFFFTLNIAFAMTKVDLINAVVAKNGVSKENVSQVVNVIFEVITDELTNSNEVHLDGFSSFYVKKIAAMTGKNPLTGAIVQIPAQNVPVFKPEQVLKCNVNKGTSTKMGTRTQIKSSMIEADLVIDAVAAKTGLSKENVSQVVNVIFEAITNELANGNEVHLDGFGSFYVKKIAAMTGKNPLTGAIIQIPARNVPVFKPEQVLENAVNKK